MLSTECGQSIATEFLAGRSYCLASIREQRKGPRPSTHKDPDKWRDSKDPTERRSRGHRRVDQHGTNGGGSLEVEDRKLFFI